MSSARQESKAYELLEQAEKRLKSFVMPMFGSKEGKFEDAAELFTKAGNAFKVSKNFEMAGDSFKRAGGCYQQIGSQHEAATSFQESGNAFKKVNTTDAVEMLIRTIDILADLGRFSQVAKHHKDIGEMYEGDEATMAKAMEHFQLAADFYQGEDSSSSANQCLLKVAAFAAQLGQLSRAVEIFEEVAAVSLESNLLKWSVKDYFQRALLCQLAAGDEAAVDKVRAHAPARRRAGPRARRRPPPRPRGECEARRPPPPPPGGMRGAAVGRARRLSPRAPHVRARACARAPGCRRAPSWRSTRAWTRRSATRASAS
jgi:alpha-soluble NSF attachment protein